jgi:hypothetical protein
MAAIVAMGEEFLIVGTRPPRDVEVPASACIAVDDIVDLTTNLGIDATIDDWIPPTGSGVCCALATFPS